MSEKVVGYLLLVLGITVMSVSAFLVYQVFTGRAQPFTVFDTTSVSLDFNEILGGLLPPEMAASQPRRPATKTEFIPKDTINQLLNLSTTLMLYGFLVTVGQRLAAVGTQLVRPIKVTINKEKD